MTAPPVLDRAYLERLLPAMYRVRDDGSLAELMAVLAEQLAAVEENLEQLYDDQFIETCADWVVPYIGDLVGYRAVHDVAALPSARAEVAHTIAFRRRKGTIAMLEQLARDVTDWPARAVEFFQLLATTQYMNHLRPTNVQSPSLRTWEPLSRIGSAFDPVTHTVDVRRIRSGRGRYNIPNVGIFLWRIGAQPLTRSPAVRVDARRWRVSPLGNDIALYSRPEPEDEIAHLATPRNVPEPLLRRRMLADLRRYYGVDASIVLFVDGAVIAPESIRVCDLGDDGVTWAHLPPPNVYAIDPERGRIALPETLVEPASVATSFHYGFGANIGGGEYERAASFAVPPGVVPVRVPDDEPDLAAAFAALAGGGVVEITDNDRYEMPPAIAVPADARVELRARNGRRPTITLPGRVTITGGEHSSFALNGVVLAGNALEVPADAGNALATLTLTHVTIVPGWRLAPNGMPTDPAEPSVVVALSSTALAIAHSIVGSLRVSPEATATVEDSVIDACAITSVAYASHDDPNAAGGELRLDGVTVIGKVRATVMRMVSNSIIAAQRAAVDPWPVSVLADRRQEGCVRFSWIPREARVPRRHRCQPNVNDPSSHVAPSFRSVRYGTPTYARLAARTPDEIRRGADDEGEMGAYHAQHEPQRETNLRIRLREYLRVGLEVGVFYES
jgi:hypothetical protein